MEPEKEQLKAHYPLPPELDEASEEKMLWSAIQQRIRTTPLESKRNAAKWLYPIMGTAASLVIGIFFFLAHPGQWKVASVPYGQKQSVMLSNGVRVQLNAGSRLRYPLRLAQENVSVELTGEACITVPAHAYGLKISTSRSRITLHPGKMNVRAYPDESYTSVTVEDGTAEVTDLKDRQHTLVVSGKTAVASANGDIRTYKATGAATAWARDNFVASNEKLFHAVHRIERRYGVKIQIAPRDLLNLNVSANITNDPDLVTVLNKITAGNGIQYRLGKNNIILF